MALPAPALPLAAPPEPNSDAALVVAAREGKPGAEEALFRRHAPRIIGLARRLLGHDDEVEDLVQDACVTALRSLKKLQDPQAFSSWLSGIVVNHARNLLRRRRMFGRLGLRRTEPVTDDLPVADGAPPEVAVELRRIGRVLATLPPEERIALVLRRVDGCTVAEVAKLMELSVSTVKRRLEEAEKAIAHLKEEP